MLFNYDIARGGGNARGIVMMAVPRRGGGGARAVSRCVGAALLGRTLLARWSRGAEEDADLRAGFPAS